MSNATIEENAVQPQAPKPSEAPALKTKAGTISGACWPADRSTKEGKVFTAYDVKLDRSFKDENGDWQTPKSLYVSGERELINLSIVVNAMLSQVRAHKKENKTDSSDDKF